MLTKVTLFTSAQREDTISYKEMLEAVMGQDAYRDIEYEVFDIEDEKTMPYLQSFFITRVPTTVLIDETGDTIRKIIGIVPERDLVKFINYDLDETNRF